MHPRPPTPPKPPTTPRPLPTRRALLAPLALVPVGALLAACGGGGGNAPPATAPSPASPAKDLATAAATPGALEPGPLEVLDAAACGERVVRAVGGLAGGGHAVVWAARDCPHPDTPPDADPPPPWTLWLQALDAEGRRLAGPVRLALDFPVASALDIAAAVLPEGRVVAGFLALDPVQPPDPATATYAIYSLAFRLDGSLLASPRLVDQLRTTRFYPRSDQLAGPLVAAAGPDGAVLLGWRFAPGSYFGRQPAWRILRLAADAEPLGWIQHLPRGEVPQADLPRALRLTPLDEGGWIASAHRRDDDGRLYADLTQIEVPRPLGLPLRGTLPVGSFVLDLVRRGGVLFAGTRGEAAQNVVDPYSQRFDALGLGQAPRPLLAIPDLAVALRGGDYVTLWAAEPGLLLGQRYNPAGEPVDEPFTVTAPPDTLGTRLAGGGLALAWVAQEAGAVRVLTQRRVPPAT
ncbi:hypothetical protein ACT80S_05970 [Ramlibacter sp. MAHUQ-53]|uniref:hypothetical protein n=1 Tax=unclassified Ramlibacter TaxID=2617605 RepID=UPI0036276281